jgi:predicted HAD superfamily Cof-like phosphohydrolase
MVDQFNETYKAEAVRDTPYMPNVSEMKAMGDHIIEELMELAVAHETKDAKEFLDALADIIYITAQQARLYGWPLAEALREVHRSNMSKLGEDGLPIIREDGKVLKGPNFSEPNLSKLVEDVTFGEEPNAGSPEG